MQCKHLVLLTVSGLMTMLVQGCVSTSEHLTREYTQTHYSPSVTDYPTMGETRTIGVGESLIWKENQATIPAIDIEHPIDLKIENLDRKATITLLPGRYIKSGRDTFGTFFEGKKGTLLEDGRLVTNVAGLYVTDSDPKKTEIYLLWNLQPLTYEKNGIPFSKSVHRQRNELNFKRELVYTGIAQNIVSVLYREFKDDPAKPSFVQELQYDLSAGNAINYRGARLSVVNATQQEITYTTLKQLD